MGFYMIMRKTGIENYKENISRIMDYFKSMDSKYYGKLEGQPEDMRDLTDFLNSKQI